VLFPLAAKHRKKDIVDVRSFLTRLEQSADDPAEQVRLFIESSEEQGISLSELLARTGLRQEIVEKALKDNLDGHRIVSAEPLYLTARYFADLKDKTLARIEQHHKREPLSKGLQRETLRDQIFAHAAPEIFKQVLLDLESKGKIIADKDTLRMAAFGTSLSASEAKALEQLRKTYAGSGLEVPKLADALGDAALNAGIDPVRARKVFQLLLDSKEIVKVTEEFYFARDVVAGVVKKLSNFAERTADRMIDVSQFKDIAGVSRKYAIPLLEYFDREKVTRRAGDKRFILPDR